MEITIAVLGDLGRYRTDTGARFDFERVVLRFVFLVDHGTSAQPRIGGSVTDGAKGQADVVFGSFSFVMSRYTGLPRIENARTIDARVFAW